MNNKNYAAIQAKRIFVQRCTDPNILAEYASDRHFQVRIAVARNPYTNSDTLWLMRDTSNHHQIMALASNLNAPPHLLDYLINKFSSDFQFMHKVINNPNVSATSLCALLDSKRYFVYPSVMSSIMNGSRGNEVKFIRDMMQ